MNNMYFIGKCRDKDEWLEGNLVSIDMPILDEDPPYIVNFNGVWPVYKQSVAAVTGLEDRNGKQILGSIPIDGGMSKGGHILEIEDAFCDLYKGIVEYSRYYGAFIVYGDTEIHNIGESKKDILGNGFDNPELLK